MDRMKVADLVAQIKHHLETSFQNVFIGGEVSNFSRSSSGHYYFTLSDESASISCVMFRGDSMRVPLIKSLVDGDKIELSGGVNVYVKRGTFQIIARSIKKIGVGDLKEEFEKLKERLAKEGLFDVSNKKTLPKIPRKVAVITAEKGAALQDFLNVFKRNSLSMDILVVPSLVQGDHAPESLRHGLHRAIQYAQKTNQLDVIVLTRGGGSLEDLWAFNDEGLAWDIYNCPIPVVSAVGHQVDHTICDFVADLRSATPTAAAEQLSWFQTTLKMRINHINSSLRYFPAIFMGKLRENSGGRLLGFQLQSLKDMFFDQKEKLERCNIAGRIHEFLPLREVYFRLDDSAKRLENRMHNILVEKNNKCHSLGMLLEGIGPGPVLSRGFSYIEDLDGHIVSTATHFKKMAVGSKLAVTFHDGKGRVQKI